MNPIIPIPPSVSVQINHPVGSLAAQVQENLLALEASLLADHSQLPTLLRTIHSQLKKDPEIVTILTEDECAILVSGLKEHTKIELVTKAAKKKVAGVSLKKTTLDDL